MPNDTSDNFSGSAVFTSDSAKYKSNKVRYLLSPTEVAPDNEPVTGVECGLAFAVYPPSINFSDLNVSLRDLDLAVAEVVGACTDAGSKQGVAGNGGSISLYIPGREQRRIDITVQRPV